MNECVRRTDLLPPEDTSKSNFSCLLMQIDYKYILSIEY